jgi:GeoRSP system PqqD family protein
VRTIRGEEERWLMNALNRVAPNDAVAVAELGDETVILNIESGVYFGLDAVGTRIWQLLDCGTSEEGIIAVLLEEYEVEQAVLRRDVQSFLDTLAQKGLTRTVDG